MITYGGYRWEPNDDGDYNEHVADVAGYKVAVYSDRDGESWWYTLFKGHEEIAGDMSHDTQGEAMDAAIQHANEG